MSGKNYIIIEDPVVAKVFSDLHKRRLAIVRPDTSTLGDASFYQLYSDFLGVLMNLTVFVSFVQKLNDAMAERPTAAQLQGKRKTQHRKAYEGPAGLRPSP